MPSWLLGSPLFLTLLRKLRSYPHTPDLSHKIVGRDSWLFFKNFDSRQIFSVLVYSRDSQKLKAIWLTNRLRETAGNQRQTSYAKDPVYEGSCAALRSSVRERGDPRSREGIPERWLLSGAPNDRRRSPVRIRSLAVVPGVLFQSSFYLLLTQIKGL